MDVFSARIQEMLRNARLMPTGYRVRTLHGLANDIVRQKPELAGLDNHYTIADERIQMALLQDASTKWIRLHPETIIELTSENHDINNNYIKKEWWKLVQNIALAFIRQAKDIGAQPDDIQQKMESCGWQDNLLQMGLEIYTDYQQGLAYRGAVDFDDLIGKALQIISSDAEYLQELQERWPYILEDEAQDSSRLQEEILHLLSSRTGNWVRVGDPNQAIYETFTTASPEYLIRFMNQQDVVARNLPESGRSTASIIQLANNLIQWTNTSHPIPSLHTALREPFIQLTEPDDTRPNPADNPAGLHLFTRKLSPEKELEVVVESVKRWLPEHPDETIALLVPSNLYGEQLVACLKQHNIPHHELLRSTDSTRKTVNLFTRILQHLAEPEKPSALAQVYELVNRYRLINQTLNKADIDIVRYLKKLNNPENFVWPKSGQTWLNDFTDIEESAEIIQKLQDFQIMLQEWHRASLLPVDQLILIIAMSLFTDMTDLALAYKIAQRLEWAANENPQLTLPDFAQLLLPIADNKEKFVGYSEKDAGFDPERYKGKVVVSTYHKAKGLEWNRVHLLSINNFDFPSGSEGDNYVSEKYFVQNQRNLQAEALASLTSLMTDTDKQVDGFSPTEKARLELAAERLRVLFVGITRAKNELVMTWNTGKNDKCQPALAFLALESMHQQEQP